MAHAGAPNLEAARSGDIIYILRKRGIGCFLAIGAIDIERVIVECLLLAFAGCADLRLSIGRKARALRIGGVYNGIA